MHSDSGTAQRFKYTSPASMVSLPPDGASSGGATGLCYFNL